MLIDTTLLSQLTAQAKSSPRLRQHFLMDDLWCKINEELLILENSVLAGYLGANFIIGPKIEWHILETLREQSTKVERISSKKTFRIIVKQR